MIAHKNDNECRGQNETFHGYSLLAKRHAEGLVRLPDDIDQHDRTIHRRRNAAELMLRVPLTHLTVPPFIETGR